MAKYRHTVSVVETVVRHYDVEIESDHGPWSNRENAKEAALRMYKAGATPRMRGDRHVSVSWVCAQQISVSPEKIAEVKE